MSTATEHIIHQLSDSTHWKSLHPNKNMLLASWNLHDGEILEATIKEIKVSPFRNQRGATEESPTVYFEESIPPMLLNVTNSENIASMYGEEWPAWIGKKVQITRIKNEYKIGGTHRLVILRKKPVTEKRPFDTGNEKQMKHAVAAYLRDGNYDAIEKRLTLTDDDKSAIDAASKGDNDIDA